jgi:hypothetical protein
MAIPKSATIDGLWVVLVDEDGQKVPMLASAGGERFLLAFKTGFSARKFAQDQRIENAEPRMLVPAMTQGLLAQVRLRGAAGVLVDYDASTGTYKHADHLN